MGVISPSIECLFKAEVMLLSELVIEKFFGKMCFMFECLTRDVEGNIKAPYLTG